MRNALLAFCVVSLLEPFSQAVAGPSPEQVREYRRSLYGKRAVIGSAAHAALGTLRNSPHEWGSGAGGFGKRFASHMGQHAVKQTIEFGVGTWHHEDPHYYRSNLHGTLPRMKYAVVNTFLARRTDRPGRTIALGRLSGNMGAGVISRAWQPASAAGLGAGLASGGIGIGAEVGVNMAREFWPRKHPHSAVAHGHHVRHAA
jgi:hypothetical protein